MTRLVERTLEVLCIAVAVMMVPVSVFIGGGSLSSAFLLGAFGGIPFLLCSAALVMIRYGTRPGNWKMQRLPWICGCVIASVMFTQWPFRLAFWISQPSLNNLAAAVQQGKTPPMPAWAGLFQIKKVEQSGQGIWCFWTHPCPSGSDGFVMTSPAHVPFNLFDMTSLNNRWQYIQED